MIDWTEVLATIITAVLVPLLTYAGILLRQYIHARVKSEEARAAVLLIEQAVNAAVAETAQTYVDELKNQGRFTGEAAKAAAEMALTRAKVLLAGSGEDIFESVTNDLNLYLQMKIEEAVRKDKLELSKAGEDQPDLPVNRDISPSSVL